MMYHDKHLTPFEVEGLLARASADMLPEFSAQSLSMLVSACRRLKRRDVPLLTRVAKAVIPKVSEFTPQALAVLAHGFARLEVRSEILFYLLAAEMVEKMPLFTGQGIGMVLGAYGRLEIQNEKLVQACRRQVRALRDELILPEVDQIERGFTTLGMLDGSTASLLRQQRRRLSAEPTPASGDDMEQASAWAADEDRLLRRMAEEPEEPAWPERTEAAPGPAGSPPSQEALPPDAGTGEPAAAGQPPDLWALWEEAAQERPTAEGAAGAAGAAAAAAAASDDATPAERLRAYLAKPALRGRPPVDLDGGPAPGGAGGQTEGGEEPTRGRRRPRR